MTDFTWWSDFVERLVVDPALPPGAVIMRSGGEQVIGAHGDLAREAGHAVSPLLAETYRSLAESAPYIIRYQDAGEPIICECCGTQVAAIPEALAADWTPRTWKRAIWEWPAGHKHTMRRCEWKRASQ